MNISALLADKSIKPKEKTEMLSRWILEDPKYANAMLEFAKNAKEAAKATCIEAMEFATKAKPETASREWFQFATESLKEKSPRVKWESAKVIGNVAALYASQLDEPINNLINNSEHTGTVVRWSAAFALSEILKLKTARNRELIPAVVAICEREEKNSIKKIYLAALKKVQAI